MSRYIVIGAGAVGAGLAAGFDAAGIPVVLVSRGRTFAAIQEHGLRYRQAGSSRTLDVEVVGSPDDVKLHADDVLVFATKSQDVHQTFADWAWRPVEGGGLGADLPVVLTQNGLEAERAALRFFRTVVGGVALIAARHVVPGEVEILNAPGIGQLVVGAFPSATLAPHAAAVADEVAADLDRAQWLAQAVPEISRWLAWKVTANATFAIAVLDGAEADLAALRGHVLREVRTVLSAHGYGFADPERERTFDPALAAVVPGPDGGGHKPSTWQSFARGSGSEVDYLNGEIALLARLHGLRAPYNEALQRVLGASAARGEAPGTRHVREVLDLAAGGA